MIGNNHNTQRRLKHHHQPKRKLTNTRLKLDLLLYTTDSHRGSTSTPRMPHPDRLITPPSSPTEATTTPAASSTPHERLHRNFSDLREHHTPGHTDPIPCHGSPLFSRLHQRLEGIRATISREPDLQSPSPPSLHSVASITRSAAAEEPRRGSDAATEMDGHRVSEASEVDWVRRRDSEDVDRKMWGWLGLRIFEERAPGKSTREAAGVAELGVV